MSSFPHRRICAVFVTAVVSLAVIQSLMIGITAERAVASDGAAATRAAAVAGRSLHIAKLAMPADSYASDEEIGKAIEKGVNFIMSQFVHGTWKDMVLHPDAGNDQRKISAGADFLAVYALLTAGKAIDNPKLDIKDPYMKQLVAAMKSMEVFGEQQTYARGIRLTALSMLHRIEDRPAINIDVQYLLDSCHEGGWTYDMRGGRKAGDWKKKIYLKGSGGDNSNAQYGLLGIWSAAQAGAEIPDDLWQVVQKHWSEGEFGDGQWNYINDPAKGEPHLAMTLAGVASLLVCHDFLAQAKFEGIVSREPFTPPLEKGLHWLETGDNSVITPLRGYESYGMERVGLASGFKYFGSHDWYRELSTGLLKAQKADGSWEFVYDPVVDTSFAVLFLAKGRHALLMNKLRFDHYWANRPHDLAALTKFVGGELEHTFNWQVVTLQHDWSDWLDAPILYIASDEAPKFTDADFAKIRGYVDAGGLLFTQQDGTRENGFNDYVEKVMLPKIFPDYEMAPVPPNHEIFSIYEPVKRKPVLRMVTNGARVLWVHSPKDIAADWEHDAPKSKPDAFHFGMNLFLYAAGKSNFRNRLASNVIATPPAASPDNIVKVARVKYSLTTWDPEPYAWKRFANWMGWETSVGVVTQTVDMEKLGNVSPAEVPMAHLTGTNSYTPTAAQIQSLQKYVKDGGVLFIDSCGGVNFNDSIEKLVTAAFPGVEHKTLSAKSPLLSASGPGMSDLSKMALRPFAMKALGGRLFPAIYSLKVGKGHVIYTAMDVTNALLGTQTWGIVGFDTQASEES